MPVFFQSVRAFRQTGALRLPGCSCGAHPEEEYLYETPQLGITRRAAPHRVAKQACSLCYIRSI